MEDKNIEHNDSLKGVLKSLDKVFSMVFVLEMVLKVTAYGPKKYLSDAWCWLDFMIVTVRECSCHFFLSDHAINLLPAALRAAHSAGRPI